MTDSRLLALFRDEAREHLDTMERALLDLDAGDRSLMEECFRRAHTLKGAARVVGRSDIEAASHEFEEEIAPLARKGEPAAGLVRRLLARIDAMRAECVAGGAPEEADGRESERGRRSGEAAMLRVESERFDRMMRLLSSLRIGREKPQRASDPARSRRLAAEEILLQQLDGEIRAARLVPLSVLELPLERAVRELATERALDVRFTFEGGAVALDRAAIDALREPLLHLVRNAVAHGVEPLAERCASGKPPAASIRVRASRLGNRCRIVVEDDGRGIDRARLRSAVEAAGLLPAGESDLLEDDDLFEYIFHRDITTTVAADELSGRGVGLEIVRTRLRGARGEATLAETGASGTRFLLELPVQLQILHVLVVRSGPGLFGVPSDAVERVVRVNGDEIGMVEGLPVLDDAGRTLRVVDLGRVLDARLPASPNRRTGFVLAAGGRRAAILADEVVGEEEILLRDLEFPLAGLAPYSGVAVMESGSIVLALHPVELLEKAFVVRPVSAVGAARKRILVADDSPTTRSLLRGVLAAAGYEVVTASDGVEASGMLSSSGAEIVVADVEMPRMNGFELARHVKSSSRGKIPVLLVTARSSDEDRRRGMESGADAYIVKSAFESEGLLETVRRFS